jgi:hypothetical protein
VKIINETTNEIINNKNTTSKTLLKIKIISEKEK